jgi:hypothetical protein
MKQIVVMKNAKNYFVPTVLNINTPLPKNIKPTKKQDFQKFQNVQTTHQNLLKFFVTMTTVVYVQDVLFVLHDSSKEHILNINKS